MIQPVILSGGLGTRLWPLSRRLYPKQLLPILGGEETLLQSALRKLQYIEDCASPIILCNEEHRYMVAVQAEQSGVGASKIILETLDRNTAPAVAVAAYAAQANGEDPLLLVLPAVHYIANTKKFVLAIGSGLKAAQDGDLVSIGISADNPQTGYGCIRINPDANKDNVLPVLDFVQSPDRGTGLQRLDSGTYVWNSGIFLFKASTYLEELRKYNPAILVACQQAFDKSTRNLNFTKLDNESFAHSPKESIEHAVLERTKRAMTVIMNSKWSNLGSWDAIYDVLDKDREGNVFIGDVMAQDVKSSYIHSTSRLIVALGLENLVLVETKDGVMVSALNRVKDIKSMVTDLRAQGRDEVDNHCRVYRPWGNYESIDTGSHYQVKRITVYPGQILSLQRHFHRSEHWVVVSGTAKVTKGEKEILLGEDESVYLPLGEVHRLENVGKFDLKLIEVQTGSYLGEDDIERLEDVYGRIKN